MRENINKILKTISTILVAFMVILALLLVGPRAAGMQVFVVLSGSMEPTYQTGSIIYVKDVDPMTLKEGDPVTFRAAEDTIVTHRIIEVIPDEDNPNNQYFRTKGDANEVADGSLVDPAQVIGTPKFSIPYLGFALTYIQSAQGRYAAIAVGALLLLIVFLPSLISEKGNDKKSKTKEEQT
jgi:signal peptidase